MIFWIILAVVALAVVVLIINENFWFKYYSGLLSGISATLLVVFGITLVIMTFFVLYVRTNEQAELAEHKARYETISYQIEHNYYDNLTENGKYQLLVDVREWNEDVAKGKALQDNFWIGIFNYRIYDELDFIEIGQQEGADDARNYIPWEAD